jgi:hypothetical protein
MKKFIYGLVLAGAIAPSVAQAQLKIDMTQWTCAQYLAMPADDAANFAAWMSGWYNQKQGYVWVNLQAYERNVANVRAFCAANPGEKVMAALDRTMKK